MLYFVVKKYHDYTINTFLNVWARPLVERVSVLTWDDLAFATRLSPGTYILTDFERLSEAQLELARHVHDHLTTAGMTVLNNPARLLQRTELLKRLHAAGFNRSQALLPTDDLNLLRYPVFVRRTSRHMGAMSALLQDRAALDATLAAHHARGETDLQIVEFVDVRGKDGFNRKYGVFRCRDRFVARHVYMSASQWIQNSADSIEPNHVAEEAAFIENNPHLDQLRTIFDLAGVEYGRIDYGVVDGRVQTWEINTNPNLMAPPHKFAPERLPSQARGVARVTEALDALEAAAAGSLNREPIPLALSAQLRSRLGVEPSSEMLRWMGKGLGRVASIPGVRKLLSTCGRARWLATR